MTNLAIIVLVIIPITAFILALESNRNRKLNWGESFLISSRFAWVWFAILFVGYALANWIFG